jgi:glycosyltransferase involved in cell wall biosynthesis
VKHKPSVLFIIGQLVRGGAEQQLYELLAHTDLDSTVVALSSGDYWANPIRDLGYEVIELERRGHFEVRRLREVTHLIRDKQPDLVHIVVDGISGLYGRLGAVLAGNPRVIVEQRSHPLYYPRWFRVLLPLMNTRIKAVVSTSYSAGDYLIDHHYVPRKKVHTIPSGIKVERFQQPAPSGEWPYPAGWHGKLIVGTVGHLTYPKSPETFIQLAARLHESQPDLRFALIGAGPLHDEIRVLVESLGVSDTVWLAGEQLDIPALLRHMDIFVLNSRSEGLPVSIIEAMAARLPCVVTNAGDCGYVVLDQKTGFVVPIGDVAALADRVAALAVDESLRRTMGAQGQERANQEFDIRVMAARYLDLYAQIAGTAALESSTSYA